MKTLPVTCEKCFLDFQESLDELQDLIRLGKQHGMDEKSQKRIIRSFEVTHELALKTIGEYFKKMGRPAFSGPRDATIEAFNEDLIDDGKGWLDMIIDRIKYDPRYAEVHEKELSKNIIHKYLLLFNNFERNMKENLG
ncbi:nucleotidyltransferase substrate binding protein [Cecembia calidifontis]|uniref:Nucleotidyltransferase substrate binding protein (TIGR01987 family) n=1 Tax=Cecembia calidifontis TaxID=1187080 RepID=A0A4V2F6I5_9BACT|nr:nucleotidyltransferase substrate binding protein [Cecembia calidifontis]RZS96439.1 nucleotidyltransferase substrate binding protein (TIGR01987 family) [Cecembia calidifontis]